MHYQERNLIPLYVFQKCAPSSEMIRHQRAKMLIPILLLLPLARSQDFTVDYSTNGEENPATSDYTFYDSVDDYELNSPSVDYPILSETVVKVSDTIDTIDTIDTDDMCRVSTGQSNIVMDLMESFGDDFSQETNPKELPIAGNVGSDIELELVFPSGYSIFRLQDKSIHLTEPLDRDQSDLSSIVFQVSLNLIAAY